MTIILYQIAIIAFAYCIGNISPAIILGKLKRVDIRSEGSGNAGTTNVLRVLGKKQAAITLIVDVLKGVLAVAIGSQLLSPTIGMFCGLAAFIGHIWPAFYGFRGGKGIATALGVILAINWHLGLVVGVIAIALIIASKRVSVGSLAAALLLPAIAFAINPVYLTWTLAMSIIIVIKHRANIERLSRGEEPKLSFSKKKELTA